MRTPRLPVVDWTDAPADLNGLVRFAERRNLVSARVPSHFKRSLQPWNAREYIFIENKAFQISLKFTQPAVFYSKLQSLSLLNRATV